MSARAALHADRGFMSHWLDVAPLDLETNLSPATPSVDHLQLNTHSLYIVALMAPYQKSGSEILACFSLALS